MDAMDRWLRAHARDEIADHGFSARVMQALPAPSPVRRPLGTSLLVMGSAVLGSVLAVAFMPGEGVLLRGFEDLVQFRVLTHEAIAGIAITGALLACALVMAADPD